MSNCLNEMNKVRTGKVIEFTISDHVKKCLEGKVPISNHPLFSITYNCYADAYNKLAKKIDEAGIEIGLLADLIERTRELEALGYIITYLWGYRDKTTTNVKKSGQ